MCLQLASTADTEAPSTANSKTVLFSCADSVVLYHDDFDSGVKSDVEDVIAKTNGLERAAPNRTDVAIHPGGKFMALGSMDGSVEIVELPRCK